MKWLFEHSKSLVALLLVMIMLLGSVLPVLAEIDVGGTLPPTLGEGGEEGTEENDVLLDAGWFVIETEGDGVKIVLHPDKSDLTDVEELKRSWKADRTFDPSMDAETREKLLGGWHKAVERSLKWSE